jgi:catechol 2,3-dioxygenase-like lactoylglutathione lyase family enzyme
MSAIGLYSVFATPDVAASRRFYERYFGLRAAFVADWYVQLVHPAKPSLQLGLVARDHESLPSPDQLPNGAAIITIEVDDADKMHRILTEARAAVRGEPRSEAWGQRHFFVQDPAGYWVDVVQQIKPSSEYSAAYTGLP